MDLTTLEYPAESRPEVSAVMAPVSTEIAVDVPLMDDTAVHLLPTPLTGPEAEVLDEQLDLEHELVELNTAEKNDRAALDEALCRYHSLLAKVGRDGKFTTFLRERLKWPPKRAYDIAMRRIARHLYRNKSIDLEEYRKRSGNRRGITPLRCALPQKPQRPQAPDMKQTFTVSTSQDEPPIIAPVFEESDLANGQQALQQREGMFYKAVLYRALLTNAEADWFQYAWKTQARRYRTRTFSATMLKVFLCGTLKAAEDDYWGEIGDDILEELGRNPARLYEPDIYLRNDWDDYGDGLLLTDGSLFGSDEECEQDEDADDEEVEDDSGRYSQDDDGAERDIREPWESTDESYRVVEGEEELDCATYAGSWLCGDAQPASWGPNTTLAKARIMSEPTLDDFDYDDLFPRISSAITTTSHGYYPQA